MGTLINVCMVVALASIALMFLVAAVLVAHAAYRHLFKGEKIPW